MTAVNMALGYSVILIAASLQVDSWRRPDDPVATLLTIINLVGLWLGIFMDKALK